MKHSFRYILQDSSASKLLKPQRTKLFKRGGSIKASENIIPNGVLHEESNNLGDKGMPVILCDKDMGSCKKKYEIEKDELIFTLNSSKKIERLFKDEKFEELGNFVQKQVLGNTHSFTDKFKYLNNYETEDDALFN